jgi:hypothetical protein
MKRFLAFAETEMKKCKSCKAEFTPVRPLQAVCGAICALEVSRQTTEKKKAKEAQEDRKKTREKLDVMRTKPQLVKIAQVSFNKYIRERDLLKPCISCGKPPSTESNQTDASHYRSVGSAPHMRFVEENCHASCKHCNQFLAGNHVEYRKGLIERIGMKALERVESDQTVRKYTKEGLVEIARHYNAEAKRLKKERE